MAKVARTKKTLEVSNNSSGFQETEIGYIPQGWEVAFLQDIATDFFSGGTPSTKRPEYWQGEIPWTTSAYISEDLYLRRGAKTISQLGLENSSSNLVPKNNLLIGSRVGVGKVAINTLDIAISQDLTAMILNREKAVPEFIAYAIRADTIQRLFQSAMRGTTIKGIARDDLKQIPIPLPPLLEQRGIAHVLSTIQRAIAAQDAVIAAAREVKRSLMHRLFTYGPYADPLPTRETEIGEIPERWDIRQCDELCEKITVGIVVRPATHYVPSGIPAFRSLNIGEGQLFTEDIVYISPLDNDTKLSKSKLKIGDVLVVRTGYPGTSCVVPKEFDGANCIDLVIVRPNQSIVASEYLSRYFNSIGGKCQALAAKTGLAQQHLNVNAVKRTFVPVPPIREQYKVVEALVAIDHKVFVEESRRAALQALFKSMLHQLMTGQVRAQTSEVC